MKFAERNRRIRASGVREFFDKGRRIPNAIDLSIGQADFEVPEEIKAATSNAIRQGCGRYGPTQGFPELVEATRAHLRRNHGLGSDEQVMMTCGASGAITLALLALVDPGDEVLVPDPWFVIYHELVSIVGGTPVLYDLYPDFRLRPDHLASLFSDRTRLVILNSPANPTGAVLSPAELTAVAAICRDRGVPVLSDELYEVFVYDAPHAGIKPLLGDQSLLVGGFSKSYGMAGWRLGWAAGHAELIDRMRTLQQFLFACPPTLVQKGALAAFGVDMSAEVEQYRRKRDFVVAGLTLAGYELAPPRGSFFAFPRVPWGNDMSFCERALEEKLILVPGSSFSRHDTHFRLSFAASKEDLERGLEILSRLAAEDRAPAPDRASEAASRAREIPRLQCL